MRAVVARLALIAVLSCMGIAPVHASCGPPPAGVGANNVIDALVPDSTGAYRGPRSGVSLFNAGMLAYDSANNQLIMCDETNWVSIVAQGSTGSTQWSDGTGGAIYYNGGNVGIGTAEPVAPLHLGDGNMPDASLITSDMLVFSYENVAAGLSGVVTSASASQRPVLKGVRARGTLASPEAVLNNDDILTLLSAAYDGATNQPTAGIFFKADADASVGIAPQRISFVTSETTGAARTEKLTIKADGNVGIGMTAPNARLQFGNLVDPDPTNMNMIRLWEDAGNGRQFGIGISAGQQNHRADRHVFFTPSSAPIERMRIDLNGNVGIGTADVREKLDIYGDALVRGLDIYFTHDGVTDANNEYLHYGDNNSVLGFGTGVMSLWADTNRNRDDWENANAVIAAAGGYFNQRVSIGTDTTPDAPLHITATSDVNARFERGVDSSQYLQIETGSFGQKVGSYSTTTNAKPLILSATTDTSNSAPSAGGTPIVFNTLGQNRMQVEQTGGLTMYDGNAINFATALTGNILSLEGGPLIYKLTDRGAVRIGKDDAMIIGDGESPATVAANIAAEAEHTYITSDNIVYVYPTFPK